MINLIILLIFIFKIPYKREEPGAMRLTPTWPSWVNSAAL